MERKWWTLALISTVYMQGVLGLSPLETGLHFLPMTLLSFIASPISGNLSRRSEGRDRPRFQADVATEPVPG